MLNSKSSKQLIREELLEAVDRRERHSVISGSNASQISQSSVRSREPSQITPTNSTGFNSNDRSEMSEVSLPGGRINVNQDQNFEKVSLSMSTTSTLTQTQQANSQATGSITPVPETNTNAKATVKPERTPYTKIPRTNRNTVPNIYSDIINQCNAAAENNQNMTRSDRSTFSYTTMQLSENLSNNSKNSQNIFRPKRNSYENHHNYHRDHPSVKSDGNFFYLDHLVHSSGNHIENIENQNNLSSNLANLSLQQQQQQQQQQQNKNGSHISVVSNSSATKKLTRQPTIAELQAKEEKIANLQMQVQTLSALVDLDSKNNSPTNSKNSLHNNSAMTTSSHHSQKVQELNNYLNQRRTSKDVRGGEGSGIGFGNL